MTRKTISAVVSIVIALTFSMAWAMDQSPEAMGKAHFTNPKFAGGKKACNDCHPNGKGLEKAGEKKSFPNMGEGQPTLKVVINLCITNAIEGQAIPEDSREMAELVSHIKSLGK